MLRDNIHLIPSLKMRGNLPPFSHMPLRGTQEQLRPKVITNTQY